MKLRSTVTVLAVTAILAAPLATTFVQPTTVQAKKKAHKKVAKKKVTKKKHSKTFKYYSGYGVNEPIHKKYISVNKYVLNKKYEYPYSCKIKLSNLYVFHVSKNHSAYQTWIKVTGRIYNNGQNNTGFGTINKSADTDETKAMSFVSNTANINFKFSAPISYGPDSLDDNDDNSTSSRFELIAHATPVTNKLGNSTLVIRTYTDAHSCHTTTRTFHLNLN